MLANLTIRDIVLIERLSIDFDPGLSVLTGETGAGKSILLDALALALGARGDAALVRSGQSQGHVTAVFEPVPTHPAVLMCEENNIEVEGPLILRRQQSADGRSRAFINDQPVSVSLLREIGHLLVEIHGQHDERAMVSAEEHRRLVDAFGGLEPERAEVARRAEALRKAKKDTAELRASIEAAEREADYLRASVGELEQLSPELGEEERLADRRRLMMQSEKIAGDLSDAQDLLGGSASPVPDLAGLLRRLERKQADMPEIMDQIVGALGEALDRIEDARAGLTEALQQIDHDPGELERIEERLFAIRAAARKYRCEPDALPGVAAEFAAKLHDFESGTERLAALEKAVSEADLHYVEAAELLSEKRAETAKHLEDAVAKELPAVKLEAARFIVAIDRDRERRGPDGIDAVSFEVQTNPGTAPGPIMKVASGGELSRFLLVLKVALADRGSAPTLVFDEIDAGVGGAVAEAIGKRLARLAERVQVMSVTHAPQVAARAAGHFVISKSLAEGGKRAATEVNRVEKDERREEIARMLAGATISEEARAAAERLIVGEAV
ncbi:DNA repair protein RecN [Afifella sp. IM 167]|uniref:DNA repair protein RecN n=1 Tax=Afifella sp. IM 167 TaxID=2033586 RepID=UPI001CCB9D53|nr:DNA repair protein RecN [Afifella sp. IM 167]MBZ8135201.1 DNA repair protein RecN [Afifella sp. IM 167]